jgi:hypothetical protein
MSPANPSGKGAIEILKGMRCGTVAILPVVVRARDSQDLRAKGVAHEERLMKKRVVIEFLGTGSVVRGHTGLRH